MKSLLRSTLTGVCCLSAASSLLAGDLAGSRPNIILVLTDDQGYAQLGCHGHPWLSKMAGFANRAVYSACRPPERPLDD